MTTAMRDGALLAGRNLQRVARNRASIVSIAVMPLIFLFGFSAVLGRSLEAFGVDDAQYLPPVIVLQAMFFTGIASAFFLADDRTSGMIERCRSLPIHPWSVLLGRLGADGVRALVSMTVVLIASTLLGFRFSPGVAAAAGFVALTLLFAVTVAGGCSIVGLSARSSEAAASTLSLPYLPLLMLSTGFVPLEGFPGWIQPVVQWQPVSLTVDALRALSSGGPTAQPVARAVAALTVLLVGFGVLSTRAFRRAS